MFVNFSEEARHILKQAQKERDNLNHPYVGSEHLFLSILKEGKLIEIFNKNKLTYDKFKNKLISLVGKGSKKSEFVLYTPLLKRVIENAIIDAREDNNKNISPELLIISILDEEDGIAYTILKSLNINIDKLYLDIKNINKTKTYKHKKILLEELGIDLTKEAKENKVDPVIGRDKEITKTLEILLRRKKNNPILIGPAGVGKTAIVEGLANLMVSNNCPDFLKNKRIISLNIFQIVSGTKYRGEFEEKMKTIIKELEDNEDIILFIDEIHTIVGAGGAEGAIDASNIFKPALARGKIKIIGATTLDEYKKYIEPDAALARRFQSVLVEEPDFDSVVKILKGIKPLYEKHHNITISNNLLNDIVSLSKKYLSNRFEPDRSIDVLDEVCAKSTITENDNERKKRLLIKRLENIRNKKITYLSNNDFDNAYNLKLKENSLLNEINNIKDIKKKVTLEDIINVVKTKGNVNIFSGNDFKNNYYEKLNNNLNNIVYGQTKCIDKLISSLRRKEVLQKKECYSVLICGHKSTGKTFLAETFLTNVVNEKNIIKINASDYSDRHMISKLIGTTAGYIGYDNKNNIFEKIRTNPNSGIIVDNFDLGSVEFQNIFLKILEDNFIEDASGKKIDFSNSIIIFTSDISDDSNKLGFEFNKANDLNEVSKQLQDRVSLILNTEKMDRKNKERMVFESINKITTKYRNIKINYNHNLINYFVESLDKKKNMNINKIIEEEFESKIIDAIINNKNEIYIDSKRISNTFS